MTVPPDTADSGTLLYSTSSTTQVIYPISTTWTSWDAYFGITDTNNCGISSCSLKDDGCSNSLSDPVYISTFDVTAKRDVSAGYN